MDGINKSKLPRYSFNVLEHHIFLRHNKMNQNLKNYVDILLFWFEILFLKSFSDASSSILIYQNEKTTNFCANRIQDFLFNNYLTWSDVTPWQEKKTRTSASWYENEQWIFLEQVKENPGCPTISSYGIQKFFSQNMQDIIWKVRMYSKYTRSRLSFPRVINKPYDLFELWVFFLTSDKYLVSFQFTQFESELWFTQFFILLRTSTQ